MNQKNNFSGIELLSPVGNLPAFYAAINHGADAVYLGANRFGARANVGFEDDSIETMVRTAHLFGKRVYVTLNTLIKQDEQLEAAKLLVFLNNINVDAVIIQDVGLLHFIKESLPDFPVHASTQMSIHNRAGAQILIDQGVNRVVLARECSIDTIASVASSGVETEIFVHGALCVSMSGQCLLSSQIGGRSGNRGRCAQPCRLQYEYRGKKGAWLSPRDLSLIERIPDLYKAGVKSFKIEGRLKNPDYVAIVTSSYRKAIDAFLDGKKNVHEQTDKRALLQVFNRGGFTQGWAFGQTDAQLINPHRVSHEGIMLGRVTSTKKLGAAFISEVKLATDLHQGDQIQIRGFADQESIYSGPFQKQGETALIRHYKIAKPADEVYKLLDANLVSQIEKFTHHATQKLSLDAVLKVQTGKQAELTFSHQDISVCVQGDIVKAAQSQAMTKEKTKTAVIKTGDRPFTIQHFEFSAIGDCFLPVSSLNSLRRKALEEIEDAIINSYQRYTARSLKSNIRKSSPLTEKALFIKSHRIELIHTLRNLGPICFIYAPQDYTSSSIRENCKELGPDDYLYLPKQLSDETLAMLKTLISDLDLSVFSDNISHLKVQSNKRMIAGNGIPALNRQSLAWLKDIGCSAAVLSHELSKAEASAFFDSDYPVILPVYGRTEVMVLNHCPERSFRSLSGSQTTCELCDSGQGALGQVLRDRMGADFPLFPIRLPEGCINVLLFHTPLNLSKKSLGKLWLLSFTTENNETILKIAHYYFALMNGTSALPKLPAPLYLGRFEEGVE